MDRMEFYYMIRGFGPPIEDGMSRWGFEANLDSDVGVKARDNQMPSRAFESFQKTGRGIITRYGLDDMGEIENPYNFVNCSWLLHYVSVPGDACDMGLVEGSQSDFMSRWPDAKEHKPFSVRYVSHNVDQQNQQDALLALWLEWADIAYACLKD